MTPPLLLGATPSMFRKVFVAALAALTLVACGNDQGEQSTEAATFEVDGAFTSIRAADGFLVTVQRSDTYAVEVTTAGIGRDDLDVAVEGNTLELRTREGVVPNGANLQAVVSAPGVRKLTATSGSQVLMPAPMSLGGDDVKIDLTAGARFEGEVSAKTLQIGMQAGASAALSGSSRTVALVGSEAAELDATALVSADADVTLDTAAVASLTVNESLRVALASGATLSYAGDPKVIKRSVKSGSSLTRADE